MASGGDRRKSSGAEDGRQDDGRPIYVSAIERCPVSGKFQARRQSHLFPCGTQSKKEGPVHYAFKMRGESHARVYEFLLKKAREQAKQEQEHSVPHQSAIAVFHGDPAFPVLANSRIYCIVPHPAGSAKTPARVPVHNQEEAVSDQPSSQNEKSSG